MKKIIAHYLLLSLLIIFFSCKEEEEHQPVFDMYLEVKEPVLLPDNIIKLSAKIENYGADRVSEYGFYVNDVAIPTKDISNEGEFELLFEAKDRLTKHTYAPYFTYSGTSTQKRYIALSFTSDFPTIDSYSEKIVTDYSTIKILGSGLNENVFFYFVSKSSPSDEEVILKLRNKSISENEMLVSLPGIGSRDSYFPPFYSGAIQPSALYVGNDDMTMMKKVGDLDYRYRFHLGDRNGPMDGDFTVIVWSARDVPPVEDIEVYFDGTKRILLSKRELWDVTTHAEFISAYLLTYSIPFGTASGSVNKVTVFSPYGEEMISIIGDDFFTVD